MLPASVAIERAGLPLDKNQYIDVSIEPMGVLLAMCVGARAEAITLGRRVFVSAEVFEGMLTGRRPDVVAHELAHADQWREDRLGFLLRYIGEYLRFRILGAPHDAAYRAISYEVSATAAAQRAIERIEDNS